jgi:protein-S-isoprenylcysteine O-methyltransferase Ste14
MVQHASQNQQAMSAANLGLARPPAIYLIAILVGLGLHFAWPIRFVPNVARPFGGLLAGFAATLFIWSIRTLRSAGTPVPGNQPTTAIVKVGPYRFTRNPIYLAFALFQTGIARKSSP